MTWLSDAADLLWRNAWVVLPVAAVVVMACRLVRFQPATRHTLWLVVLLAFIVPLGVPRLPVPGALRGLGWHETGTDVVASPDSGQAGDADQPVGVDVLMPAELEAASSSEDAGDSANLSPPTAARIEPGVPEQLPAAPGSVGLPASVRPGSPARTT